MKNELVDYRGCELDTRLIETALSVQHRSFSVNNIGVHNTIRVGKKSYRTDVSEVSWLTLTLANPSRDVVLSVLISDSVLN